MNEMPSAVRPWFCSQCGSSNASAASFCTRCGSPNPLEAMQQPQMYYGAPNMGAQGGYQMAPYVPKRRITYIVLGIFLGTLGIHNFYAGRNSSGVAQLLITLLTFWLVIPVIAVWVWNIIELIAVDKDGRGLPMN